MSLVKPLAVVAFGDSITEARQVTAGRRWPNLVAAQLRRYFPRQALTMRNAGVGGNTSREGVARFERDVLTWKPDYVLIEFGGNDATPEPPRHVELDEFLANLGRIQKGVEARGAQVIVLTFPPVIDSWHVWWGAHQSFQAAGGLDAYVERYRELTRQFARRNDLPLADIDRALRQAMARDCPETCIMKDGVHLTETGNRVVAETVFAWLKPEWVKAERRALMTGAVLPPA